MDRSDREAACAVILAAGLGTRMKSARPKAAHEIAGRPMLRLLLDAAEQVFDRIVVVIGPGMEQLAQLAAPHPAIVQQDRRGTGHAALCAASLFGEGEVAILFADNPLIRPETLRRLTEARRRSGGRPGPDGHATRRPGPLWAAGAGRGRSRPDRGAHRGMGGCDGVRARHPAVQRRRAVRPAGRLLAWLGENRPDNAAGEYYLTDLVRLARRDGATVVAVEADEAELRGINSRSELAAGEAVMQQRLRAAAMAGGATLTAPETVFLAHDTRLGRTRWSARTWSSRQA